MLEPGASRTDGSGDRHSVHRWRCSTSRGGTIGTGMRAERPNVGSLSLGIQQLALGRVHVLWWALAERILHRT
jgi:hypothetical protein